MNEMVVVNDKYIAEYYAKRQQLNRLKDEVEEMSDTIKLHLEKRALLGKTYGNYVASISIKNRLNSNFIQMLKEKNMQDRIVETCNAKDCKDIIQNFTKEDEDKYFDEWYKQLIVRKIR